LTSKTEELKLELEALKYAASMGYPSSMLKDMFAPFTIKRDVALAQPEQEPVAWRDRTFGTLLHQEWLDADPLYTAPPKRPWGKPWVSLTDEEYDEIWRMDLNNKDIMNKTIAKLKEINT